MKPPTEDLYAILNVPVDADVITIRQAYRRLMRQYHPDLRSQDEKAQADEETALLTLAEFYLTDRVRRRAYDATRTFAPPPRAIQSAAQTIDLGVVRRGERAEPRSVRLRFDDGSRIGSIWIANPSGTFWCATSVMAGDAKSVDVHIAGQLVPADVPLGRREERLRIQLDEATAEVTLVITVEPEQVDWTILGSRRRRQRIARRLLVTLAVVLAVMLGFSHVLGQPTHRSTAAKASEFCYVASSKGQVLSFHRTKLGTTQPTSDTVIWSVMKLASHDSYVAWWTPAFPYWERANQHDGFVTAGQTYRRLQDVEVLAVWSDPWDPLSTVFTDYPDLTGGPSAEAAERQMFITSWSRQLNSPPCRSS